MDADVVDGVELEGVLATERGVVVDRGGDQRSERAGADELAAAVERRRVPGVLVHGQRDAAGAGGLHDRATLGPRLRERLGDQFGDIPGGKNPYEQRHQYKTRDRRARGGIAGLRFARQPFAILGIPVDHPGKKVAQSRKLLQIVAAYIGGRAFQIMTPPQFHDVRMIGQIGKRDDRF